MIRRRHIDAPGGNIAIVRARRFDFQILRIDQNRALNTLTGRNIDLTGQGEAGIARNLHKAAIAAVRPALSRDTAGHAGRRIRKNDNFAAVALIGRIRLDGRTRGDPRIRRGPRPIRHRSDRNRSATGFTRCVNDGGAFDCDVPRRGHRDRPADGTRGNTLGTDLTGYFDIAADTGDRDRAGLFAHGPSGDSATGSDKVLNDPVRRCCRQLHGAAGRSDRPIVGDQRCHAVRRLRHLLGDVHGNQAVAVHIQRDRLPARQHHVAHLGIYGAGIPHCRCNKRSQTGTRDRDCALVDDLSIGIPPLIEHHLPGEIIPIANPDRCRHQPVGVDLRPIEEHHPRLILDNNLSVGVDFTGDLRGIRADDTVQRGRCGGRNVELNGLLTADVKLLPLNNTLLSRLIDRCRGAVLGNADIAGLNRAAGRLRVGRQGCRRERNHHRHGGLECRTHHQVRSVAPGYTQQLNCIVTPNCLGH